MPAQSQASERRAPGHPPAGVAAAGVVPASHTGEAGVFRFGTPGGTWSCLSVPGTENGQVAKKRPRGTAKWTLSLDGPWVSSKTPHGGVGQDPRKGLECRLDFRKTPSNSNGLGAGRHGASPPTSGSARRRCEAPDLTAEDTADLERAAKGPQRARGPQPGPDGVRSPRRPRAGLTGWRAGPGRAPTGRRRQRARPRRRAAPRGRART